MGNTTRREFIKWMVFGIASATLASCTVIHMTPGIPVYYASTMLNTEYLQVSCTGFFTSIR